MDNQLVNKMIMDEIGLEIGPEDLIIDQDFTQLLTVSGKNLKFMRNNKTRHEKNIIEFNPSENVKVMVHLFSYYLNKKNLEDGTYFPIYFPVLGSDGKTSALEIKGDIIIKSKYYKNESLKYLDIIMHINGEENVDLSYLDR